MVATSVNQPLQVSKLLSIKRLWIRSICLRAIFSAQEYPVSPLLRIWASTNPLSQLSYHLRMRLKLPVTLSWTTLTIKTTRTIYPITCTLCSQRASWLSRPACLANFRAIINPAGTRVALAHQVLEEMKRITQAALDSHRVQELSITTIRPWLRVPRLSQVSNNHKGKRE